MLDAQAISKRYPTRGDDLVILSDITLSLDAGQAAVIMGPSGSGKSTLLNVLGTLDAPSSGTVTLDGVNPFTLDQRALAGFRNRRIGFIFQDHHLLPQCNVVENVLLPSLAGSGPSKLDRARELLGRVGLSERLDHTPAELSGGERQRVAIARALINEPALILADEPTGNLDATAADHVADLLVDLHDKENVVLVVVTHSDRLAKRFQTRFDLREAKLVPAS